MLQLQLSLENTSFVCVHACCADLNCISCHRHIGAVQCCWCFHRAIVLLLHPDSEISEFQRQQSEEVSIHIHVHSQRLGTRPGRCTKRNSFLDQLPCADRMLQRCARACVALILVALCGSTVAQTTLGECHLCCTLFSKASHKS